MDLKNNKVLVTGSNGFIGKALVERLKKLKYRVLCLDRRLLYKPKKLIDYLNKNTPSKIFHLAAYGNHSYQADPKKIFKCNVVGTFNILNAIKKYSVNSFINVGSSSEYGTKDTQMEETMLPETDTFYGATKVASTYICRSFAKQLNIPIVTVRPFSVYGPGEGEHRFIPKIIDCALNNKILLLSPGVHDWIFIDDFINGLLTVEKNAKMLTGQVVNIGTGKQYSNLEITNIVSKIIDKKINIQHTKFSRNYDTIKSWCANNKKLSSLGWIQKNDIITGIEKTINAQKNEN